MFVWLKYKVVKRIFSLMVFLAFFMPFAVQAVMPPVYSKFVKSSVIKAIAVVKKVEILDKYESNVLFSLEKSFGDGNKTLEEFKGVCTRDNYLPSKYAKVTSPDANVSSSSSKVSSDGITDGTVYYHPQESDRVLVTVDKYGHITSYTVLSTELENELQENGLKNISFIIGHTRVKHHDYRGSDEENAKEILRKGQAQWKKGELEKALTTLEEVVRLDPSNKKTDYILKSMQLQKKKIDGLLKKASNFIDKSNYIDAKKSLQKASFISDKYARYQKIHQKLIDVKEKTKEKIVNGDKSKRNEVVDALLDDIALTDDEDIFAADDDIFADDEDTLALSDDTSTEDQKNRDQEVDKTKSDSTNLASGDDTLPDDDTFMDDIALTDDEDIFASDDDTFMDDLALTEDEVILASGDDTLPDDVANDSPQYGSDKNSQVNDNRIDPKNPKIDRLINEWISLAKPPINATDCAKTRYEAWGRAVGRTKTTTLQASGKPDNAGGRSSSEYLWSMRDKLDSVDHCTLGEYVTAKLENRSYAHCKGRYKAKGLKGEDVLGEGRKYWNAGKLDQAVNHISKAQKLICDDEKVNRTLSSMKKQKNNIDKKLEKTSSYIQNNKLDEAEKSLGKAAVISNKYGKYIEMKQRLEDAKKKQKKEKMADVRKQVKEQAQRNAESRQLARDKAQKELEARRRAEEQLQREAEEKMRIHEKAENTRRQAAEQAEKNAKRNAESRQLASDKAQKELEAKRRAEEQIQREAEEKIRIHEKAENARRQAAEQAERNEEARRKARIKAAEEKKREKARRLARKKAAEAKRRAQRKAQRDADAKRRAQRKAQRDADARRRVKEKSRRDNEAWQQDYMNAVNKAAAGIKAQTPTATHSPNAIRLLGIEAK